MSLGGRTGGVPTIVLELGATVRAEMTTFDTMNTRDEDPFPPPSRRKLMHHLRAQAGYAAALVLASLALGMMGYHWVVGFAWDDSFENAAMLLGGMGPVGEIRSHAGKIFAGVFSLYAGLVFLVVTALVLTPVFHYVLHRFHWEKTQSDR
jgi:hypothetical protein